MAFRRFSAAAAGVVTTFTVDPSGNARSRVSIASDMRIAPGLRGRVERLAIAWFVGRVYRAELRLLDRYLRTNPDDPQKSQIKELLGVLTT